MNSLVTRLLHVPTLVKGNAAAAVETSAMVASRGRGRGGRGNRGGGHGGRGGHDKLWCSYCGKENHTQNSVMTYMVGLIRQHMSLHLKRLNPNFLMKNIRNP